MLAWMRRKFLFNGQKVDGVRWLLMLLGVGLVFGLTGCQEHFMGMLNPKGIIATHERRLFFDTMALMLIVVLPVIIMSLAFVYHYQVSHRVTDYKPNWSHSYFLEVIWWGVPCVIVVLLAAITWKKTHELDPYALIPGETDAPMVIEAIALPWQWLFIYPDANIATLNYLEIPVGRQVEFVITADNVPMSALFIPQLGSQIYAMAGMRTRLHLLGNVVGTYVGMNTQYNGGGFSDMQFPVNVVTPQEMQTWINTVKHSSNQLTNAAYLNLLIPQNATGPQYFASVSDQDLFAKVIGLYLHTFGTVHPRSQYVTAHEE